MKSQGRISAGWSFTAGTFFGALAVFAVPAALHNSRAGAGASGQRLPAVAGWVNAARAPEARDFVAASGAGASVEPAAAPRKAKPNATNTQRKLQGHSELDLQLD